MGISKPACYDLSHRQASGLNDDLRGPNKKTEPSIQEAEEHDT